MKKGTHCVKSVQIRSFFWSVFSPNAGKYGSEKTPYLDTFHTVNCFPFMIKSILKDTSFFCVLLLSRSPFIRERCLLENGDFSNLSVKRCLFNTRYFIEEIRYPKLIIPPFSFIVQVKNIKQ